MMPRAASSFFRTYPAIAPATRRTFSKVKSSAMRPRQPSVPNLIWVMVVRRWSLVARSLATPLRIVIPSGARDLHFANAHRLATNDCLSHQLMQLLLIQMLHHFADILRSVERS